MNTSSVAIAILIIGFLVLIILRFPVAYAVALASMACLVYQGKSLNALCQQMVKGISSFSLMAVPFFITMGILMGSGGISEKLIALANACVGWMRGGMAMVNIVASYFFGGISGSASADTASLGSILIPMMVDQGYDGDFSTAVTITSSCEGLLVPPSHNMVIYAMAAGGVSVGSHGRFLYYLSEEAVPEGRTVQHLEAFEAAGNQYLGARCDPDRRCRRCRRCFHGY